jgi:hypothetical protein
MASIVKEVTVDAPALTCWDALRDFGALHLSGRIADLMDAGLKAIKKTLESA